MSFWDLLGAAGGAAGAISVANKLGQTGEDAARQMGELAGQLQGDTAFKGYGVKTGLGEATVGADGTTDLGVGRDEMLSQGAGSAFEASQAAMQNAMGDNAAREQEIYNRAMAMQQPGLDAQRAQQQAREFAMGRGGVRGSQFGGTAEDAAMARAQAQAQNQASFQAMGQSQQEMMNQAGMANMFNQMGQGMYGQSYMPLQQQLNAMQVAQGNANMAQTGQLTGAGYGAQLGLGGIQAQINAEKAASELYGNVFNSIMNNSGDIGEAAGGLWDKIKGLF